MSSVVALPVLLFGRSSRTATAAGVSPCNNLLSRFYRASRHLATGRGERRLFCIAQARRCVLPLRATDRARLRRFGDRVPDAAHAPERQAQHGLRGDRFAAPRNTPAVQTGPDERRCESQGLADVLEIERSVGGGRREPILGLDEE